MPERIIYSMRLFQFPEAKSVRQDAQKKIGPPRDTRKKDVEIK